MLNFNVSVEADVELSGTFVPIADVKWDVMNYAAVKPVTPTVSATPAAGVNLANYMFQVRAPKGTGFQVDRQACGWPPRPWPNTNSGWFSASSAINIVRCEIGDGTKKLEIWLSIPGARSSMFKAYDGLVTDQLWHRADHITSFAIATPLVRNATPPPVEISIMKHSIKDAARAWNTASLGYTFGERRSPSNPDSADVIVEGYSTGVPNYVNLCNPYNNPRNRAVACARWRDPAKNPHNYPHRGKERVYFEYPPEPDNGGAYLWTRDPSMSGVVLNNVEHLYMPAYIAHELGHTAGLGHNATDDKIMSKSIDPMFATLADEDKKAMKSIYNSHAAH